MMRSIQIFYFLTILNAAIAFSNGMNGLVYLWLLNVGAALFSFRCLLRWAYRYRLKQIQGNPDAR